MASARPPWPPVSRPSPTWNTQSSTSAGASSRLPNDPLYATGAALTASSGGPVVGQWYLKPPGPAGTVANTAPSAINAESAWDLTTGSPSIVVAVLDTGLRFDHVDLQGGNVVAGYDMVSADDGNPAGTAFLVANDGGARDSDASDPGDAVTSAEAADKNSVFYQCDVSNSSWHGTRTVSLIGASTNNTTGMASVARNVKVMPVRVLGKCGGFDSDILAGMLWASGIAVPGLPATTNKARVLNMSLGGEGACPQSYKDAMTQITAAGVVVVAASGNESKAALGAPANCPGIIAVGGLRSDGDKNNFSNVGPEVAISAPGGNCGLTGSCQYPIITATNTGRITPVAGAAGSAYNDGFNYSVGTSFSTPMVAGAAALLLSVKPAMTPAEVLAALQSTARPFPTAATAVATAQCVTPSTADQTYCICTTATCGAGMLDVRAALVSVLRAQARITVATTAPTATQQVLLSATDSVVSSGHSIVSYQWSLISGGGIVSGFVGATTGSTVTVLPSAAGTFTVGLTTTDDLGGVSTAQTTVTVAAVPVVVTPPVTPTGTGSSSSSSSGGGALGIGWLLLLLSAVLALAAEARYAGRLSGPVPGSRKG